MYINYLHTKLAYSVFATISPYSNVLKHKSLTQTEAILEMYMTGEIVGEAYYPLFDYNYNRIIIGQQDTMLTVIPVFMVRKHATQKKREKK